MMDRRGDGRGLRVLARPEAHFGDRDGAGVSKDGVAPVAGTAGLPVASTHVPPTVDGVPAAMRADARVGMAAPVEELPLQANGETASKTLQPSELPRRSVMRSCRLPEFVCAAAEYATGGNASEATEAFRGPRYGRVYCLS